MSVTLEHIFHDLIRTGNSSGDINLLRTKYIIQCIENNTLEEFERNLIGNKKISKIIKEDLLDFYKELNFKLTLKELWNMPTDFIKYIYDEYDSYVINKSEDNFIIRTEVARILRKINLLDEDDSILVKSKCFVTNVKNSTTLDTLFEICNSQNNLNKKEQEMLKNSDYPKSLNKSSKINYLSGDDADLNAYLYLKYNEKLDEITQIDDNGNTEIIAEYRNANKEVRSMKITNNKNEFEVELRKKNNKFLRIAKINITNFLYIHVEYRKKVMDVFFRHEILTEFFIQNFYKNNKHLEVDKADFFLFYNNFYQSSNFISNGNMIEKIYEFYKVYGRKNSARLLNLMKSMGNGSYLWCNTTSGFNPSVELCNKIKDDNSLNVLDKLEMYMKILNPIGPEDLALIAREPNNLSITIKIEYIFKLILNYIAERDDAYDLILGMTFIYKGKQVDITKYCDIIAVGLMCHEGFDIEYRTKVKSKYTFNENTIDISNVQNSIYKKKGLNTIVNTAKILFISRYFNWNNDRSIETNHIIIKNLISNEIIIPDYATENIHTKNMYEQGVNVHDTGRDSRTVNIAIEFLKMKFPSDDRILNYYDDFVQYVITNNLGEKLAPALGVNLETGINYVYNFPKDYNGGLLTHTHNKILTVSNFSSNIKLFFGKLWYFSETYEEQDLDEERLIAERKIIKSGLINALIRCNQNDFTDAAWSNVIKSRHDKLYTRYHVICFPGRLQNIVASVLDNRIKDSDGKLLSLEVYNYVEEEKTGPEEIIPENENLDEIGQYLVFFSQTLQDVKVDVPKFYSELYNYIHNLNNGQISKFAERRVNLNIPSVIYYTIMIANDKITPELSLVSDYEDMFDIQPYLDKYLQKEQEQWEEAHPEYMAKIEANRLKQKEIAEKRRKVMENQQNRIKTPKSP